MTDTPDAPNGLPRAPAAASAPKVSQRILAQYIRDLSFENVLARKGVTGEVARDRRAGGARRQEARRRQPVRGDDQAHRHLQDQGRRRRALRLEIEYVGVFQIEGVPRRSSTPTC
jgi:preprotein translocase subunit SecB